MSRRRFARMPATFLASCAALLWAATVSQQPHGTHWSYEGKEGPQHWAKLDPAYATCGSGHAQSPIDITHAKPAELAPLEFAYQSVPLSIINNGHTIQVNYPPGSTLKVGDRTYTLKQFHFHHPSEESIAGRRFDLVAHLVHDDGSGHLAVVAVLFKTGPSNPLLASVWGNLPAQTGKVREVPAVSLNAQDLLPADHGYYTYSGSLTTPPCTEGVTWYALKVQSTLSSNQLAAFAKLYPKNARSIQPLSGREILETK